ncbi:DUF2147 domain-containing protein [Rhizosaccharibacter radicis]|uniref:DUF2147 domain-containing protein n=1 Tax=Rhizosaccharibacter radicis TaxID=2782605 RepID=A0ABT1VWF1_9PROT|nr:DUF2147 domain-containing protein [Acetobacteraceae bacterium KSS12]
MTRTVWRRWLPAAIVLSFAVAGAAGIARAEAPLGFWLTEDGDGVFEITRCGDELCGRLQGMRYSGSMPEDVWHRPQCHLPMLNGFRPDPDEPGHWDGTILDPDNGRTYHARIWNPSPGVLALRGYLLLPMFGQTQHWTRYGGSIGADCKLPSRP